MEIVLLEDVKALGKKGQIVKVNDGYARSSSYITSRMLRQVRLLSSTRFCSLTKTAQSLSVHQL